MGRIGGVWPELNRFKSYASSVAKRHFLRNFTAHLNGPGKVIGPVCGLIQGRTQVPPKLPKLDLTTDVLLI